MELTNARPRPSTAALIAAANAVRWTAYFLFFVMLFLPTAYQALKAGLLGTVLAGIAADAMLRDRIFLDRRVVAMSLGFAALGALFVLRGVLNGAPGALAMFNVYVTWPLAYTVLVAGAASQVVLRGLIRIVVIGANAIAVYSLVFVLHELHYWPDVLYVAFDQGQAIGFYGSYVEFNLYSISSLLFITPFLIAALLVFPAAGGPVTRRTLWVSLGLNILTVLLTGRRALLILLPIAPALALFFRSWLIPAHKRASRSLVARALWGALALAVIVGVSLGAFGGLSPRGFVRMVSTGFEFNTDPVAMLRRDQLGALVTGWLADPFLGSGHGAAAPGVIRSVETPWAYELSYMALLYHTGLVGLLAYASGVAWIGVKGYEIARSGWIEAPSMVATFVGTASFLIANATNPYLEKYDYVWVIFLPVAFVNCYQVTRATPQLHADPPA
ncbi:MAG: hypothetical protein ABI880_05970 [Acidobacteriota bacterium]